MWYIFKSDGNCIASSDFEPNIEDLSSRGEIAVESQLIFDINKIVLKNSNIVDKLIPQPTLEELLSKIRTKRNQLLSACDWTQLPDAQLTIEQKQAWTAYRQQLRDFPETCDPYNPVWPVKPG